MRISGVYANVQERMLFRKGCRCLCLLPFLLALANHFWISESESVCKILPSFSSTWKMYRIVTMKEEKLIRDSFCVCFSLALAVGVCSFTAVQIA